MNSHSANEGSKNFLNNLPIDPNTKKPIEMNTNPDITVNDINYIKNTIKQIRHDFLENIMTEDQMKNKYNDFFYRWEKIYNMAVSTEYDEQNMNTLLFRISQVVTKKASIIDTNIRVGDTYAEKYIFEPNPQLRPSEKHRRQKEKEFRDKYTNL